jgi:ribosome-binding protein aMBF1 (putative translation factor)
MIELCAICGDQPANIFVVKSDQALLPLCTACIDRLATALRIRKELEPIIERDRIERLN